MAVQWEPIAPEEFETYPEPTTPAKKDPYEGVIPALQEGQVIRLHIPSEDKLRGAKMTLSRRAKAAGVDIELRQKGLDIVVRQVGQIAPVEYKKSGGRPRKSKAS
jgi:hypothetical protein